MQDAQNAGRDGIGPVHDHVPVSSQSPEPDRWVSQFGTFVAHLRKAAEIYGDLVRRRHKGPGHTRIVSGHLAGGERNVACG
ncbi:MAG: hypothetical protein Q7J28_14040 [Caulobacter sp.]|nr:hypothetical protein [Caulobacter sp.]